MLRINTGEMKARLMVTIILVLIYSYSRSQSADITKGCSPMQVSFSAPDLSSYYWEFIEGNATSVLKNPIHIFTNPGIYKVTLYEGNKTNKIGEIQITVYPDPIIEIEADTTVGCAPFTVNFTPHISIDSNLKVVGYKWAFGEGGISTEEKPKYVYESKGEFDVTLEVTVDLTECSKSFTVEKMIHVNALKVDFEANTYSICDYSGKIKFFNLTEDEPGNRYHWNFGNNKSSDYFAPPDSIYYKETGSYDVVLSVTTKEGCVFTKEKTVSIGKPIFDLDFPNISCIYKYAEGLYNDTTILYNNTGAKYYYWDFVPYPDSFHIIDRVTPLGDTVQDVQVILFYNNGGDKTIHVRAFNSQDCYTDTLIHIFIETPDASFEMSPIKTCHDSILVNFSANDKTHLYYHWSFSDANQPDLSQVFYAETHDSIYWNTGEVFIESLIITSKNNCNEDFGRVLEIIKPNADFCVSRVQGCAPLSVIFSDTSFSYEKIIKWTYYFGTGDSLVLFSPDSITYTYLNPGEYYAKLVIENEDGCIDTSASVLIRVGMPIIPQFEVDKTEICIGDTVTIEFKNTDPRIDSYHINSDDGLFSQCWNGLSQSHAFKTEPGEYPLTAITEYNGCYSEKTLTDKIKVNGAKAKISYLLDCKKPHDVFFKSIGSKANFLKWTFDTATIINVDSFVYHFDSIGTYNVYLEAKDTLSNCDATYDTAIIYINEIKADFYLPEKICDSESIIVDGSISKGVFADCNKGYLWELPAFIRPRETSQSMVQTTFPRGNNKVMLIVEDINGCRDTLIKYIKSYGIDLKISFDKDTFCVPAKVHTINQTSSDTTLTWKWRYGKSEREPTFEYDTTFIYHYTDMWVRVEDALGCKDSFFTQFILYKPKSKVLLSPRNTVCIGDDLIFSAKDFTEHGSYLDFKWILNGVDTFYNQTNTTSFDHKGQYPLYLQYTEHSSGCKRDTSLIINAINPPIANFNSDVDGLNVICYPRIVTFTDSSYLDGQGYIEWFIDDLVLGRANLPQQSIKLGKGEHQITLIAQSFYGCSDTITKTVKLVGPEGKVVTDKNSICAGGTIEFKLINQVDVHEFDWDFGDGKTNSNINPIKHTFDREIDTTIAKIVLKSAEGCNTFIEIPLIVQKVIADFEHLDSSGVCEGYAFLLNKSINSDKYKWNFPSGKLVNDGDTVLVVYPGAGEYAVTLISINSINGCTDTISKNIELMKVIDNYSVPNIFTPNGDGENDVFRPVILNSKFEDVAKFKVFKVYNRWGNLVYDNADVNLGWDGKYNDKLAPEDVYGYYLELEINGCQTITKKGNVTLIR